MLIIVKKAFEIADTKDSKMVSSVPVKKQLMAVKLDTCQAGYWCEISFTAKGIAGTFHRGYYQYYKKYAGSLCAFQPLLLLQRIPLKRAQCGGFLHSCPWLLPSILESFYILIENQHQIKGWRVLGGKNMRQKFTSYFWLKQLGNWNKVISLIRQCTLVSWAAITKYHKFGVLKQQKSIISQFWRLEV